MNEFYDDSLQVRNEYAIIAIITYEHACINGCGSFFWKTLNCFGERNIIFVRTILLNSIHVVEVLRRKGRCHNASAAGNIK